MLPQIVCLSCGYHRTWATLVEALADGQRHHAEHPPEAELPETRERRCPACQSEAIAPTGHVSAAKGMIHAQQRCEACGIAFVFVRKALV